MPPLPSIAHADKALAALAAWASKSSKLSKDEKSELRALALKAGKPGAKGLKHEDRVRMAWLIHRAAPEKTPRVVVDLIARFKPKGSLPAPEPKALPAADPLERLVKLGTLRARLTEAQFEAVRTQILADPTLAPHGAAQGVDPLDRLEVVGQLQTDGVLSTDQAAALTAQILDVDA